MTIDLLVRTSAILMSGALIATLLRRAAPATRHLVWHLSIVIVLLAPWLAPLAPKLTVPSVPGVPHESNNLVLPVVSSGATNSHELETHRTQPNDSLDTLGTVGSLGTLAAGTWFALCWLLSGWSILTRTRQGPELWSNEARAIARRLGMKRPPEVRESLKETSPHVAGAFHSVVVMPPSAKSWTMDARQAALVHELTHIKRHDRRTQAIAQLACAIYWFNPLVWYAAAGLARERERACDDEVLRFGAKPSAYALLLLDLARARSSVWTPATALSMARPSAIEGRLLAILADAVRTPHRSTRWVVACAIVTITTAILGAQANAPASIAAEAVQRTGPRAIVGPQAVMALDDRAPDTSITAALIDALRDGDGQVREQAAMGLAITPGANVIAPLISALKDPDAQVREKAAIGLAFRRDPAIVDPLLTALEDPDAQVREKAAIALGASGDPRAVPALTRAMKDADSQVREKAVAGLVLLGLRQ
jgi:beta-lactamase regulating signal transducer with metallopeptidase domain